MLPSFVQAVFHPSVPKSPKQYIHDVAVVRTIELRKMDDFLREVKRLFEAPLQITNLLAMSGKLQEQFRQKLQDSNICMLPSYNHTLPTGNERGTYLALDVGGSTFRVALVELCGKHKEWDKSMRMVKIESYRIDNTVRALKGHAFFDWMAERIAEVLEDAEIRKLRGSTVLPMGMAWSFPVEETSIRSGRLLDMGKGFNATMGVLGDDLGELVMRACRAKNLNVHLDAIINDSSATLLCRAYRVQSTRMALILGTGTNAAIHLPVSALARTKFGSRPQAWHDKAQHVLVNTEMSMFGKDIFPTTRWDDYLNRTHPRPDFQPFEHLISGRYLGEIVRLIMLEAIDTAGLFGGEIPSRLTEPYSFDTGIMAAIEADDTTTLAKATSALTTAHPLRIAPSKRDMVFLRQVSQLVSRRAAAYLATGIHALWSLRLGSENLSPSAAGHVTIGCNGSVLEKYPGFRQTCQNFSDELTRASGAPEDAISLEIACESSILGAAVAACCREQDR
ncbi:hypothetical protein W97_03913 [Coniosporium apollinis CBS 100218]|uniref:Phosphotransferase n=1 Tax=Coniosporium apollinis (strain CBS 100218) TaxID=1168221 RepID=R7YRZ9_CONA1|nr:uncharacterized protein W97_03913 [Coniosporium apollinis CBS 100218]EON64680.1 hypothetical protein W97_03913 [Coniosporium apollinis CBS 100218]